MNQVVAGQKGRILVTVFASLVRTGENACTRFVQWKQARQIAQTFNLPWLVLHPYGPTGSAVTQSFNPHTGEYDWLGSQNLGAEIERYQPDYVVCGCPDNAPYEGGHWADRIGRTVILNPGCLQVGDTPCYIELDLDRNRARWRVPGMEESVVSLRDEESTSSENTKSSNQ
jgi:Icc-related predicted phosphoesterase